jgi:CHAT domain-containing protein/Tfp pilus assembly protein PilF
MIPAGMRLMRAFGWRLGLTVAGLVTVAAAALPARSQDGQLTAGADASTVATTNIRQHLTAGRLKDAESGARALLAQIDQRDGAGAASTEAAAVLDLLVEALWRGNPRAADGKELADRVVQLKERLHGADHLEVAVSLHNLGNLQAERGEHAVAQQTLERVLRIRERLLPPDDLALAATLTDLGLELSANGQYARARSLHERALGIREKRLGADDLAVAISLNNLGALLKDIGRYDEAEPVLLRSLAIREKQLGPDHLLVASTVGNLAFVQIERGRYDEARTMYDRVIAINERVHGPAHHVVARNITNMAIAVAQAGDHVESRRLFVRAHQTMETALGPKHPDVASALNNLATIDQRSGDLASARAVHERALALREAILPADHADIAESLHNLGAVLRSTGDYATARTLYGRALAIRERVYGQRHRAVASTLNNLGAVTRDLGEPLLAERYYRRSLDILEGAVGANHLLVAQVLTNLGPVLHDLNRNDEAATVLGRSLTIYETSYGAEHPMAAAAHDNLAANFHRRGNHAQARAEYERAFVIRTAALGPGHPEVGQGLVGLANELLEQGDFAEAFRIASLAESTSLEHVRATVPTLPERQALALASTRASGLDLTLTIATRHPGVVANAEARVFDLIVRSRALVLDEMAGRQRDALGQTDATIQRAKSDLTTARRRLANLVVRSATASAGAYRNELDQARTDHETAERALAERHAAFGRDRARARATITDVVRGIPAAGALVAFAKYQPAGEKTVADGSRYVAFVVRADGVVRLVPLDSATRIDTLVERWRNSVTGTAPTRAGERSARRAGVSLRRAIWDPLTPLLQSTELVLVVPDGALNLVNLSALPDDGSGYLVESPLLVHYLSAERDLAPMAAARSGEATGGLLALGGAAFDTGLPRAAASTPRQVNTIVADARGTECGSLGAIRFEPLPGTSREASAVVGLWKQSANVAGDPVDQLAGPGASEVAFKRQAPGRRILHLATHGFFIDDRCPDRRGETRGVGGLTRPPRPSADANPLRLSGLALAGANRRAAARTDGEDGILTAEEIASLDLRTVEWSVLSACDTGLGEIRAGEGVFGLRRAFAVAGSRTAIMSLWAVEDRSTLDWMTRLYRARLIDARSTADSMREASRLTLQSRRARGLNTHPFYWAAFVAAGDWR